MKNENEKGKRADEVFSLTDIQLAYLLGRNPELFLGGNSTHFYVEINTQLDPVRLEQSINKVILQQPMLRTIILQEGKQKILSEVPEYKLSVSDISSLSEDKQKDCILAERKATSHRKFKTDSWPLFSFRMFKLNDKNYRLIADLDMMIMDGLSTEILINEVMQFYNGEKTDITVPSYTFKDYVCQQEQERAKSYESDMAFWKGQATKMPSAPELNVNIKENHIYNFEQKEYIISAEQWSEIKTYLRSKRVMPAMFLLGIYADMLSRWSNQSEFTVNLTTTNRRGDVRKLENIIGDFTEVMPVDVHLNGEKDIYTVAKELQKTVTLYRKHSTIGGIAVMKEIARSSGENKKAIFPVVFTSMLYDSAKSSWNQLGERVYQISQTPQVLLDNTANERNGSLIIRWDYLEECFDKETIQNMFEYYVKGILQVINSAPPEINDEILWDKYNTTADDSIPKTTLQQLFVKQAEKTPDKTAVVCGDKSITYSELNKKSDKVCRYLIEKYGYKPCIVLEAEKSIETIICMLACLKAGGSYVPVEPMWPSARKEYVSKNANAAAILEPTELALKTADSSVAIDQKYWNPDSMAYAIYTSGSTGNPKGVAIAQYAVCNTILDINRKFNVGENDVIIGISSFCFDLSVYDVFGTLCSGASCVILKNRTNLDEYSEIMQKYPVTIWNSVPQIFQLYIDNTKSKSNSLRLALLSGDWIPVDLPKKAKDTFENVDIISLGGATEGSIWSIYYPIKSVNNEWTSIPYGYPLANQSMHILDFKGRHCPVGVNGEIYIGGDGVAMGYLNDPEKNKIHFINHQKLGKIYRTGDYGYMSGNGYIIFTGRKDAQIKLNGYRVELGEIENKISKYNGISAAVADVSKYGEAQRLTAYIVPEVYSTDTEEYSAAVKKAAQKASDQYPDEIDISSYAYFMDRLENVALGIMIKSLDETGAVVDGKLLGVDKIISEKGVSVKYRKLLKQWLDTLEKENIILKSSNGLYDLVSFTPPVNIDEEFTSIINSPDAVYWKDFFEFILLCKNNMVKILKSELNPLSILFPDGNWKRAENYYADNPVAKYNNYIVAQSVAAFLKENNKTAKILEVGAGTGGTTASILNAVKDMDAEYHYTDLSTFFTDKAKEKFSDYNFVKYGLFNIDREPQTQGYDWGEFDVIVGANVLHDAQNLHSTLLNLKNMLTPNGMLIMLETTENKLIHKVSIGLLEGFSGYEDQRLDKNVPLLNLDEWQTVLKNSGYTNVSFYPENGQNSYEQHAIFAFAEKAAVNIDTDQLKKYLVNELPSYMIPEQYIKIDHIPLSSNGKADKKLLPKPNFAAQKTAKHEIAQPTTPLEKDLCNIFSEALSIKEVGITENLFEIGIDSLKAISVVTKCGQKGYNITLMDLYSNPTIKQLGEYIGSQGGKQNEAEFYTQYAAAPSYKNQKYPLNEIQKAYLFGRNPSFELGNISTHYYTEILMNVDINRIEESINTVIEKQPMLRTVIYEDGTQQILESVPHYKLETKELSNCSEAQVKNEIENMRSELSHKMYPLGKWPMFDFKAIHLGEDKYYFFLSIDVMIADGASILLLGEIIADCYKGKTVEKPEFDFYDYMQSYENLKKSDRYKEDERYWTSKVDTFPECVQLPYRILPSDVQKPAFRRLSKTLNSDQWNKLKDISKAKGVTTASMLCSAYSRALSKFSGSNNFGINLTMFNRYPFYKDIENIIGDFTSTVILDIKTEKDFWEQTKAIQKNMFEGIEHRSYDGVDFIKQLSKKGGNPLSAVMPVVFTCAIFDDKLHGWNDLGKIQYIISQTPQVALDNQTTAMDGELHITWDFVDQLFEPEMIQALFDGYTGILEQLCNEAENPTITSDELVSSVTAYNNTKKDIPLSTLDSLFEERVLESGDKTAVVCENSSVTYSQLNSMANQVANYLFENNYNKCGVAVSGEKCIEIIAAIMGILKAGCYYVPVAVDVPPARQKYILENSNSSLLIDRKFLNNNIFGSYSNEFCEKTHHIDDIAYIIYTLGSTGTPKGVVIKHSAACNTILDINEKFNVNENDNIIGISSLYFDLSVYDIFGALSTGASLVLVKDQRNVNEIKHILRTNHITFWNSVPAILDMTVSSMDDNETYEDMRHILLSGDWIPLDLFDKAKKKFPNCDVTSLGGATEASIWSIYYPINKVEEHWKSIPYGYPLANQTCYVLDKNLEMCPFSVPGELYIGGIGLANGYCGREKETAQHFIVHPELGALYRTGDNAVYTKEGYIEFLGRIDSQVKVNGYRIELDEISNTLKQSLCVKDAISFVQKDGKSSSIVSYIIPATKKIRSNDNQESIIKSGAESAEILPAELSPKRYAELSELLEKESLGSFCNCSCKGQRLCL